MSGMTLLKTGDNRQDRQTMTKIVWAYEAAQLTDSLKMRIPLGKGIHPIVSRVGRPVGRLADKRGF